MEECVANIETSQMQNSDVGAKKKGKNFDFVESD